MMTARSVLWLVLGIVGVPFLIEGTGGCGFSSSPAAPIDDNAYTCGCRCDAIPVTKTVTIVAASDDAEQEGINVRLHGNELHLGPNIVGLRFVNVGLPKDATIVSAAVQFTSSADDSAPTSLFIVGLDDSEPTFSDTDNDISGRPRTLPAVPWSPGPWANNETGPAEQTPDLSALLAELVSQADWSPTSPVVLRFEVGTGQRRPVEFEGDRTHAAVLQVTFTAALSVDVPVCATPDIVAQNVNGVLPQAAADADCHGRVTDNLKALGGACGYPTASCTCGLVVPDQGDATFDRDVCEGASCDAVPVDTTCSNFDPNGFWDCLRSGGSEASCAHFIAANSAAGGGPVCLAVERTPGMAARLFGNHSTCERQRVEPHPGRRPRAEARPTRPAPWTSSGTRARAAAAPSAPLSARDGADHLLGPFRLRSHVLRPERLGRHRPHDAQRGRRRVRGGHGSRHRQRPARARRARGRRAQPATAHARRRLGGAAYAT